MDWWSGEYSCSLRRYQFPESAVTQLRIISSDFALLMECYPVVGSVNSYCLLLPK